MDVSNTCVVNGSLQISTEVIAKIARMAALEIEGVKEVSPATAGVKGLLSKSKSVAVSLITVLLYKRISWLLNKF